MSGTMDVFANLSHLVQPLREFVQKSAIDETSLPNSTLNRKQADRFIDLVIDYSNFLRNIRTERIDHPKGQRNKLNLGNIVMEGARATGRATTRVPTESVMSYDTEKYRAAFDLKSEFEEDNIEKGGIRNTLLNMFTKQIAVNTEMAAIEGDDDLDVGAGQTDENNLLGVNDGFRKILLAEVPSAQQIDAAGAAPSKQLYYEMRRAIPKRFRVAKPDYRWILPDGPFDKINLDWTARATGFGDQALASGQSPGWFGIPMLNVPLMPEDLTFGSNGTDGCDIWLSPLNNFVFFIQREITIEFERRPRQDLYEATIHMRVDFEIEDPNLCVIAKNVSLSGSDYT